MFTILKIMSSVFKFYNNSVQFFIVRILTNFHFLKVIVKIRNKMSLIVLVFLIKYVISFTI